MTQVEFNKNLFKIEFECGINVLPLEKYLLACLIQLEKYKDEKPSFELFLLMYDQARTGQCDVFDPAWKEIEFPQEKRKRLEFKDQMEWDKARNEFRFLIADLIHTRKVRTPSGQVESSSHEWETEKGLRFYNGTTPDSILKYAATRFENEYQSTAFLDSKVTWMNFWEPIIIGIIYE